jgi:hypothetical protein
MDRELHVLKGGYLLASADFNYTSQTGGNVHLIINHVIDLVDDIKSVSPLLDYETSFSHGILNSIDEAKAFDKEFLKKLHEQELLPGNNLKYEYGPVHYRYVINGDHVIGIANIHSSFIENTKELQFTSARSIREDHLLSSDSLEANVTLLKRLAAVEFLSLPYVGFGRVY